MYDADLFCASTEFGSLLALPQAGTHEAVMPSGPSREELLDMLS